MTLFIGPLGDSGGPAIKNKILLKYLDPTDIIKVCNTHNRAFSNLLKSVLSLILSKEKQIIISVSRNGRLILYPVILLKKTLNPTMKYSTICIGGTIVEESLKYPRRIGEVLRKADLVSAETKILKKNIEDKLDIKNTHYMPNYKEINEKFEIKKDIKNTNNLRFVFLSSIRNIKGVPTMIEAFKEVLKDYPTAILDLYGPIRKDFDLNIIENIKNIKNINYLGVVNNMDVIKTLKDYDVFIFPTESQSEGFPAVLIEAYLAGLIVICSDSSYNEEIVKNNINGWIFSAGNKDDLVTKIEKCFENKNLLNKMASNNINEAMKFDAKNIISKYKNELIRIGWEI